MLMRLEPSLLRAPAGSSATPKTQDIAKAVQVHKEDPWITLIERLWESQCPTVTGCL